MIARYVPGPYGGQMLKHEDGAYVRQEDYAELQRQLTSYEATVTNLEAKAQGLAAENARLTDCANFYRIGFRPVKGAFGIEYKPTEALLDDCGNIAVDAVKTPSTDAELAEICAQGVDLAIEHLIKKFEGTGGVGVPVMALEHLASELRKEQGK